jgi:hypothetical protein
MSNANFEYKCRRCGQVYASNTMTGLQNAEAFLVNLVYDVPLPSRIGMSEPIRNNGMLKANSFHDCADGGKGISDVAGYRVEESLQVKTFPLSHSPANKKVLVVIKGIAHRPAHNNPPLTLCGQVIPEITDIPDVYFIRQPYCSTCEALRK